jgi:hypothetical protein
MCGWIGIADAIGVGSARRIGRADFERMAGERFLSVSSGGHRRAQPVHAGDGATARGQRGLLRSHYFVGVVVGDAPPRA